MLSRNHQGEGVVVAVVLIELVSYEAGRRGGVGLLAVS